MTALELKKYEIATCDHNKRNNSFQGNAVFNNKVTKDCQEQLGKISGIFMVSDQMEEFFLHEWTSPQAITSNEYETLYLYVGEIFGKKINLISDKCHKFTFRYNSVNLLKEEIARVFPESSPWIEIFPLGRMVHESFFDERVFYRMIALNEFIENASEKENYATFIDNNTAKIDDLVLSLSMNIYDHTEDLLKRYGETPMFYMDRSAKRNDEIFGKLFSQDIKYVIDNHKIFPRASLSNYSKAVENMVSVIDSWKNNIEPKEISTTLAKAFSLSVLKCEDDVEMMEIMESFSHVSLNFHLDEYYGFHNDPTKKMEIAKVLYEHSDELSPLDMSLLMHAMVVSNSAFRSANREQSMSIVHLGLKSNDPVGFTRMISEIIMMHDGVLASYSEWQSELESHNGADTSTNYSIGSDFLLDMMAKTNRKSKLIRSVVSPVEQLRKKFKQAYIVLQK